MALISTSLDFTTQLMLQACCSPQSGYFLWALPWIDECHSSATLLGSHRFDNLTRLSFQSCLQWHRFRQNFSCWISSFNTNDWPQDYHMYTFHLTIGHRISFHNYRASSVTNVALLSLSRIYGRDQKGFCTLKPIESVLGKLEEDLKYQTKPRKPRIDLRCPFCLQARYEAFLRMM